MFDWLMPMSPWHWLVIGLLLAALELLTPAFLFLPMGIAAVLVGALLAVAPAASWSLQLGVFAVLSVTIAVLGRLYLRRHPIASDEPTLNRRGHQYVGRVFTLDAPIVNGAGKIRVDDSTWKVLGADAPAGRLVRVVGVDGTMLQVEPAAGRDTPAG
jgi:membrane protein implicated in regulation of membrane protease activity